MNAPYLRDGAYISSDVDKLGVLRGFLAHFQVSAANAVAADADVIHAAVIDTGAEQVITTGITNPAVPRNITATAGGTATDIKAIQIIIEGTNINDEVITEILPAFTIDTAGTVEGSKAFKTVTKVTIPAHDGMGATTSIGLGSKLGLPYKLAHNTCLFAFADNVKEGMAPSITTNETALESNTITLNSALAGKVVDAYFVV